MKLIIAWILNALALLAVTYVVPGIHITGFTSALLAAAVIGFVNMLIKPILVLLTLPVTILTLGLFILVINGVLFYGVGHFLEGFSVTTIGAGIIGALVYSFISWVLSSVLLDDK